MALREFFFLAQFPVALLACAQQHGSQLGTVISDSPVCITGSTAEWKT